MSRVDDLGRIKVGETITLSDGRTGVVTRRGKPSKGIAWDEEANELTAVDLYTLTARVGGESVSIKNVTCKTLDEGGAADV